MRLPARLAAELSLIAAIAAAPVGLAQEQKPELTGGQISNQSPEAITRIEATAPQTTEAAPQPLGSEAEVACFGYLGAPSEGFIAQVIGAQEVAEQTDFTTNNLLYLDAGADRGIKPGDEFWIVTPGSEVLHPASGRDLGRFYDYRGRAVVLCVEGHTAIVRVTHACTDIRMGSFLKPYEPIP